jgi:Transposase IS116/IS110/IS902 family
MGPATRFATAAKFRSFTGLAPKASETGQTDRKGQPISKAGNRLLRTTLYRAADNARRVDPQLARIYYLQMVERGNDHLGAVCVVAARLAERAWVTLDRGMAYVICDTDGTPVTAEQAKAIIAERFTVPEEVRRRRRSRKGKVPQQVLQGHVQGAQGATRLTWTRPPLTDQVAGVCSMSGSGRQVAATSAGVR